MRLVEAAHRLSAATDVPFQQALDALLEITKLTQLQRVVRDWTARLQQMAEDPDPGDGQMARELLAALVDAAGCAECTEDGTQNCTAGCRPVKEPQL